MATLRKIQVEGKEYDLGLNDDELNKLRGIDSTLFIVVSVLPEKPVPGTEQKIYIVKDESEKGSGTGQAQKNIFKEYIYVHEWELIGSFDAGDVNMEEYLAKDEVYVFFDGFISSDYTIEQISTDKGRDELEVLYDTNKKNFIFKEKEGSSKPALPVKFYKSSSRLNSVYFYFDDPNMGPKPNRIYKFGEECYVADQEARRLAQAYTKDRRLDIKNIKDLDRMSVLSEYRFGGVFNVIYQDKSMGILQQFMSGTKHQMIQVFETTISKFSPLEMSLSATHKWWRVYNGGDESAEGLPPKGTWSAWSEWESGGKPSVVGNTLVFK